LYLNVIYKQQTKYLWNKIFKTLAERLVYHPRKNGLKKNATLYRLMLIQNRHTTRRDNG